MLITTKNPETFAVHVFHGDSPVCMERCAGADEAAVLAERFWHLFVDRAARPFQDSATIIPREGNQPPTCPHCQSQRLTRVGLVLDVTFIRCDDCLEVFEVRRPDSPEV